MNTSSYPPFAVTVDIVVFAIGEGRLQVVLIERANPPFQGGLALPGGFVDIDEDLADAAARELAEETGLESPGRLHLFGVYGAPGRDPRMRTVSAAYWVAVSDPSGLVAGSDAADTHLVPVDEAVADPGKLAFDHHLILTDAVAALEESVERTSAATGFCPPEFTIAELRRVYEIVWGVSLDPGNFQNKVNEIDGFLVPTGTVRRGGRGRPPELYRAGPGERIEGSFRRPRSI